MIWDIIEETGFNRHFSDPNTTITTLLLDENIITELKNQNPQLLQFLESRKHDFMTQLIQYTIRMPQESEGYDRCHRLPYISSQLLAIDSDLIYGQFFRQNEEEQANQYWIQLLTFLDGEGAENEILMGYFQKVVNNLYAGNKMKTTVVVSFNLPRFVRLLPNGSIADILKQCLVLLNVPEGVVLPARKGILNEIIHQFATSTAEVRIACADILSEVVNKFQAFSSGDLLIEQMLASPTLLKIYDIESSEAVNQFLIALIKKTQQRTINQNDESVPLLALPQAHKAGLSKYLSRQAGNIRNLAKSTGFIVNQNQQTVRKSNKAMYSLINLLGLALQQGIESFVNEGIVSFFWNLVVLYPYNNILHVLVKKIFIGILNSNRQVQQAFLKSYEVSILNTKQNLTLLRPFVYVIWTEAKKFPQITTDLTILSDFQAFVAQNLQPMLKYQVKNVQKQSHTQMKLIVDEQDKAVPKQTSKSVETDNREIEGSRQSQNEQTNEQQANEIAKIQSQFDEFTFETGQQKLEKQPFQAVKVEKESFDFFGGWGVRPQQPKESESKADMFDNFF